MCYEHIFMQYVLPEAIVNSCVGCPVASTETPQCSLPQSTPLCATIGAQLLEPPPSLQLEADREQQFLLRAPGMSQVCCHLTSKYNEFLLSLDAEQHTIRT